LVVTRWRDEQAFHAWMNSAAFGQGHRSQAEREGGAAAPPVGVSSELWSYEIAGGSAPTSWTPSVTVVTISTGQASVIQR